jgi:hypothetical protein
VGARDAQSATPSISKNRQNPPKNRDFREIFITAAHHHP